MSVPVSSATVGSLPQPQMRELPEISTVKTESVQTIKQTLAGFSAEKISAWANSTNEKGMTLLAMAVEAHTSNTNKMDMIAFLVNECGTDPNRGDNDNWTPLYRAATGTSSNALEFLLIHKADPNLANRDGSYPIHRIVDRGELNGTRPQFPNPPRCTRLSYSDQSHGCNHLLNGFACPLASRCH